MRYFHLNTKQFNSKLSCLINFAMAEKPIKNFFNSLIGLQLGSENYEENTKKIPDLGSLSINSNL